VPHRGAIPLSKPFLPLGESGHLPILKKMLSFCELILKEMHVKGRAKEKQGGEEVISVRSDIFTSGTSKVTKRSDSAESEGAACLFPSILERSHEGGQERKVIIRGLLTFIGSVDDAFTAKPRRNERDAPINVSQPRKIL